MQDEVCLLAPVIVEVQPMPQDWNALALRHARDLATRFDRD
jgi:hypothetical protein